jgi:hypothetical protein
MCLDVYLDIYDSLSIYPFGCQIHELSIQLWRLIVYQDEGMDGLVEILLSCSTHNMIQILLEGLWELNGKF